MRKLLLLLSIITVLCLSTAPAMADVYGTATVEYVGAIRGMTLQMTNTDTTTGVTWTDDLYAGLLQLDITALSLTGPDTIPADSYLNLGYEQAFCIDLWDLAPTIPISGYAVKSLDEAPDPTAANPDGPMGPTKAAYIAELLINNTYNTAQDAAAVQVAIWEILEEEPGTTWNVSNTYGDFYLGTGTNEVAVATSANLMLTGITSGLSFDRYTALSLGAPKSPQDYVVIPTPAAILLGVLGLGAVGLKLRKFA